MQLSYARSSYWWRVMHEDWLQSYAHDMIDNYNLEVYDLRLKINITTRLKNAGANCRPFESGKEHEIKIAAGLIQTYGTPAARDVVRHELIHEHEYLNRGDTSHDSEMFNELKKKMDVTIQCPSFSTPPVFGFCSNCNRYIGFKQLQFSGFHPRCFFCDEGLFFHSDKYEDWFHETNTQDKSRILETFVEQKDLQSK